MGKKSFYVIDSLLEIMYNAEDEAISGGYSISCSAHVKELSVFHQHGANPSSLHD